MSIKATLSEVRSAFTALTNIGQAPLPPKAAYRIARLISKLRDEVRDFEESQKKLLLEAGAELNGNSYALKEPAQRDGEVPADFAARLAEHRNNVRELSEALDELLNDEIEIDVEPIPLSLFDHQNEEKATRLSPNDLANAGAFIEE